MVIALFDKFNEKYDWMRSDFELVDVSLYAAICEEIDRRFGEDKSPVIQAIVLKTLMKEIDISRIHWRFGGRKINHYAIINKIDRRYGQSNDLAIQMLHIKSVIVYGLPDPAGRGPGGRSMRAETIYELDEKLYFLPNQLGNHTEAEAVAAVPVIYNAIGQRFGVISDYVAVLYLTERGMNLGRDGYYGVAIVFFDEVVRRFNKDDRPEIRLLVQDTINRRAAVEKRLSP